MKRLSPSHKLILHLPALLVGKQRPLFKGDLLPELFKTFLHDLSGSRGIRVMDRDFVEPAIEEFPFHGGGRGVGEKALPGLNPEDAQSGLIPGDENIKIQGMLGRPRNQLFRGISPAQPEGRLKDGLGTETGGSKENVAAQHEELDLPLRVARGSVHGRIIPPRQRFRKPRTLRRGFALVEATLAMSLLSVVGLLLLKLSLNVIAPRQYTLQQVLSDSYMTFERARADRIPFETLLGPDSPWPAYPAVAKEDVVIGRLPGGATVTGTVIRTRIADPNNFPVDGGTGTVDVNPAAMKIWKVQSILSYKIADRTYLKSRTLVRSQ